ncbi:MAG: hypothetical protein B7Y42_15560, partial [Polaromonas sp. 28-63-22]
RLTLAPDGTPWLYDSIHACGCYHLFFPTPRAVPRPPPPAAAGGAAPPVEWAFVPTTLPAMGVGQRVVMRLASGTHYIEGLRPLTDDAPARTYGAATSFALVDDNALAVLAHGHRQPRRDAPVGPPAHRVCRTQAFRRCATDGAAVWVDEAVTAARGGFSGGMAAAHHACSCHLCIKSAASPRSTCATSY